MLRKLKDIKTNELGTYIDNPTLEEQKVYGDNLPVGFYRMDTSQFETTMADDLDLALKHLIETDRLVIKVKQKLEKTNENR